MNRPVSYRENVIRNCKRLVIKVGSRLLSEIAAPEGQSGVKHLISQISTLRGKNIDVVLVSSGAISTGMERLEITKRPRDLPRLQALAAVGQSRLLSRYEDACTSFGFHCAQVLLSYDDLHHRQRQLNVCNCLYALLRQNILPIINENDTVSVDEISFGDNDKLTALVATMIRADLTIILTTVDGLMDYDSGGGGERLSTVSKIDRRVRGLAKGTDGNAITSGGMISKLDAAQICMGAGESLWIANGRDPKILEKIFRSEDVGTLFYSGRARLRGSKRWLAFFTNPKGTVIIDDGAATALTQSGKSLLPSGIIECNGRFKMGDTIAIQDRAGGMVGMGITNYKSDDIETIKGLRTNEISRILGNRMYEEIVHRDNMVILDKSEGAGRPHTA